MKFITKLFTDALNYWRMERAQRQAAQRVASIKATYPGCEGAMNAWPPTSGVTTGYEVDGGVTTIRWGTDGLLQSPKPSSGYYIVTRFNEKELVDISKLPNGSGVTSTRVRIKDGVQWSITVRDDTNMAAPKNGGSITVVDGGGFIGTVGLRYVAKVVDANYESAVKQPGERVIVAENLLLIESQTGTSQV
jgi:hypothetical protein